jgi:3-methyladenine DNA glycosylase AlkD
MALNAFKNPTTDPYLALIARLQALGNSTRAEKEKDYQKSSWEHWGVALPKMDLAIRDIPKDLSPRKLLSLSARLWREPVWDLKIVAARIVARDAMPATEQLWKFVRARVPDLDGWAVADNLASVGSRCLLADPRRLDDVEFWITSQHLWTRRAALVFTLRWTRNDRDPERMLRWASTLADDPEWFIQKAIGWWLRELSKRNPKRVQQFLREHSQLKSFARREASKYLDKKPSGSDEIRS